ncbi:hypothetical protein C8J57DRAFT_751634 [Mycena rebaudengoi]|nr:hypothetical protein C8J57DRAFT_751634 [Mycena rebaudengoi]
MLESDADEEPTASSSSFNSRRPFSIPPRRTVRPRHHAVNRELSPPPLASPAVDRRHVSWEAPARDTGVSQYLSALSHGFDSQSLSIADMANTISRNSNAELPPLTSHYYRWGESDSPFSSFFPRSSLQRHADPSSARSQDTDNAAEGETSVPSLPSPDYLGRVFEGADDILNVARPPALATSPPPRPPSPPPPWLFLHWSLPFDDAKARRICSESSSRKAATGPRPSFHPSIAFRRRF